MTNSKEIAEKLGYFWGWINGETEMVTVALEAYGRECRAKALEDAARAADNEHLEDPVGENDRAYGDGVRDAVGAIRDLKGKS